MHARVIDGVVIDVFPLAYMPDGVTAWPLEERFTPDLIAELVEAPEGVSVGDVYADGKFSAPPPPAPVVPVAVTQRQARLALLNAGKLAAVTQAIATLPPAAQIEWEFASSVERASPLVAQLGEALQLDIDALFIEAASL